MVARQPQAGHAPAKLRAKTVAFAEAMPYLAALKSVKNVRIGTRAESTYGVPIKKTPEAAYRQSKPNEPAPAERAGKTKTTDSKRIAPQEKTKKPSEGVKILRRRQSSTQ